MLLVAKRVDIGPQRVVATLGLVDVVEDFVDIGNVRPNHAVRVAHCWRGVDVYDFHYSLSPLFETAALALVLGLLSGQYLTAGRTHSGPSNASACRFQPSYCFLVARRIGVLHPDQ